MNADDNLAEWDAAYVLGALTPREQDEYERYLAADPERASAVAELRAVPPILDALTPEEAYALLGSDTGAGADDRVAPGPAVTSLDDARAERRGRSRAAGW